MLIDDLLGRHGSTSKAGKPQQIDLFADFNGLPSESGRTEFYQHDAELVQPYDFRRQLAGDGVSWPNAKACAARCSASISTRPTASSSTPTSSGPQPAAM